MRKSACILLLTVAGHGVRGLQAQRDLVADGPDGPPDHVGGESRRYFYGHRSRGTDAVETQKSHAKAQRASRARKLGSLNPILFGALAPLREDFVL